MITQISFGNTFTSNGKTVVGGSNTGYDTESLVNELANLKRLPAVQMEERLDENALQQAAFAEFETIMARYRDAASLLRNPPGVANAADNIFEYRNGSLASNTSVAASNYMSVTVEPGTDLGNYDVTVDQVATYNVKTTETFALADENTDAVGGGGPFNAGTLRIGPNDTEVTIGEDDTLAQIVSNINAVSDTSMVRASILKVSDGQYRLQFKTTETGSDYNYTFTDYHQQNGTDIVIEAEEYNAKIDRSGDVFTDVADAAASGGTYIEAQPDDGDLISASIETTSPETKYLVKFDEAGTYYIHALARGDSSADSFHVGLDGTVPTAGNGITSFDPASFVWSDTSQGAGGTAFLTVDEPGFHDVSIFMREDGTDIDKIILTTDPALSPSGTGPASTHVSGNNNVLNVAFAQEVDAQDAQLTIDNTTITRSTNNIDDLVDGITFNLQQATPEDTTLSLEIEPDNEIVSAGILSFVDAYNELRIFYAEQTELDEDGLPTEDAVLSKNQTLRSLMTNIVNELTSTVTGLTGDYSRLADMGITLGDFAGDDETAATSNILTVDQAKLDAAILSDFSEVRDVFELQFTSTDSDLQIFSSSNSIGVTNFTLDLDFTGETYQASYTDSEGNPQTIDVDVTAISGGGYLVTGQSGTVLAGLEIIYGDTADTTATITLTQGLADRLYNVADGSLEDDGIISAELEGLQESNDRLNDDIERIDRIVERFREQQLARFAALEALISSVNTILQSLDAQANAQNNS